MTIKAVAVGQYMWMEGKTKSDADFIIAEMIIRRLLCLRTSMKPAVSSNKNSSYVVKARHIFMCSDLLEVAATCKNN